jgi:ADP-heptose:LPS heptosyltransferase
LSNLATFYRKTESARKIIVVDLGFLGDTIHLVPSLWEIKRHYPQAELHVLTTPLGCEVLGLARCVDRAWAFPLGPKSPPWWRHLDIIRGLRRERFDLAFNFSGADRTIFITALTGANWRVAYCGARKHFWSNWLIPDWVERIESDCLVFEKRRQVLNSCGMDLGEPTFDLALPAEAQRWAESNVPKGSIHLSINASTPLKEWPLPRWIELARILSGRHSGIALIATGSAHDREQARLREFAGVTKAVRVFPHGLTVAQLAALLSRCRMHIGADSGVLHLAMALNVPTVSIFREYPGLSEWAPRGVMHRHVTGSCSCINAKEPPCLGEGFAACLNGISAQYVGEQIRDLFK